MGRDSSPIAIHARRILTQLSKKQNIVVLAQKTGLRKQYSENRQLLVNRVWQRGNPLSLWNVIDYCMRNHNIRNILFMYEFPMFGAYPTIYMLPVLTTVLKLMGKHVYVEFHQVPFDIRTLKRSKQLKNNFMHSLGNFSLRIFYQMVAGTSDKIIVFEEDLRDRLSTIVNDKKLVVIPAGVTIEKPIASRVAKRRLGLGKDDFVVLCFGMFDWHKGTDWIARTFANSGTRTAKLLLAGGKNTALRASRAYQAYCRQIAVFNSESSRINTTGFVPDEEIRDYFSAADVVVLPYRAFMSHSSALTLALGFGKPVLFSDHLLDYVKSPDFSSAMDEAQLTTVELFFPLEEESFLETIQKVRTDAVYQKKLVKFSQALAQKRLSSRLIRDYQSVVSKAYVLSPRFAFNIK